MNRADYSKSSEMLDDIEEALDAQENYEGLLQTQMVAEGAWTEWLAVNLELGGEWLWQSSHLRLADQPFPSERSMEFVLGECPLPGW